MSPKMRAKAQQASPPACPPDGPKGRRLLPHIVEQRARDEPDTPFYFISGGLFQRAVKIVTYRDLARSVDRLSAWLDTTIGPSDGTTTIAFISSNPQDLRYWIILLAGMKTGHRTLFPSPRNSAENNRHLMCATGCQITISDCITTSIAGAIGDQRFVAPALDTLLEEGSYTPYQYNKSFDQVENDVVFIYHSSGSTGSPKPIPWTHGKLAAIDRYTEMKTPEGATCIIDLYKAKGPHSSLLPFFHAAGFLYGLLWNIIRGNAHITFPVDAKPTAESVSQFLKVYKPISLFTAPSILEDMVDDVNLLPSLDNLKFIHVGGASMSDEAGQIIQRRGPRVHNSMGSTESGCYPSLLPLKKDAINYYYWSPQTLGIEFRERQENMYELVFTRAGDWAIFHTFPDIHEYPTKDLYEPHSTLPYHWKLVARTDDVLVLSSGEKVVPLEIEGTLRRCPQVQGVLVIGHKRFTTAALVELDTSKASGLEKLKILAALGPFIDEANRTSPGHARLSLDRILFTTPEKPMVRTAKGTVVRSATLALYEVEIDAMYSDVNGTGFSNDGTALVKGVTLTQTRETLVKLIKQATSKEILPNQDFFQAGMDSGNVLALTRCLKTCLQKEHPEHAAEMLPSVVYSNPSVPALAIALHKLVRGDSPDPHTDRAARIRGMIDRYGQGLSRRQKISSSHEKVGRTVVLTGTTGSLGSYLLHELIGNPEIVHVYALNRSDEAGSRQSDSNTSKGLSCNFGKVTFLQAALHVPYLGLTQDKYNEIVERADLVIHNAWPVNFNQSLETFEPHVHGVRNLIDLSMASNHAAHILFVSSVGTTGNWGVLNPNSGAPEHLIDDPNVPLEQGYSESKYVSEHILALAANAGVSSSICRVGQVAGPVERKIGIWNKQEWFPSLIKSSYHLRLLPASLGSQQNNIDWIPVDSMAKVLVELGTKGLKPQTRDQAQIAESHFYNLVNTNPADWSSLLPAVQQYMPADTAIVSFKQWLAALKQSAETETLDSDENPAVKLSEFWDAMDQGSHPSGLLTDKTREVSTVLKNVPSVNEMWVKLWMEQWGFVSCDAESEESKGYFATYLAAGLAAAAALGAFFGFVET